MSKIKFTNSTFKNVGTAFKITGDVELEADANVYTDVATVLDVSPGELPSEVKALINAVKAHGVNADDVRDALKDVAAAPVEAREKVALGTRLIEKVKDAAPAALGLLLQAAIAYGNQHLGS